MANFQNENPPRISPGGPIVARAIATSGTSAVGNVVAIDDTHISRDRDNSMTRRAGLDASRPAGMAELRSTRRRRQCAVVR